MKKKSVSKATLGRLPQYLQLLKDLPPERQDHISATCIARMLSLGEVQVRKDLAAVSGKGKPKLGYVTSELISNLEALLGSEELTYAVLVGAGKLGKALLGYRGFERFGIRILSGFDVDSHAFNQGNGIDILSMECFGDFCKKNSIHLGIITVGEGSAQDVCNAMVENGITAIWNFAPCSLKVPHGVLLQNENLALSLAHLSNKLSKTKQHE